MSTPTTITAGINSDWVLEVAAYVEGQTPSSWTPVRGIQSYTPPGITKNREDDSDFDSGVWASEVATGLAYEFTGTVKVPRASMAADPGQEILRKAGASVQEKGFVHFRTWKRGAAVGIQGVAEVQYTHGGGERTGLTTAEVSGMGRGAVIDFTVTSATPINATATAILNGSAVGAVEVTAKGTGYTVAPTVVFSGGGGTGATATAYVRDGGVVAVDVTAGGTGYTSAPSVSFTRN